MGIIKTDIKTPQKDWKTDIALILFFQLTFYCTPFLTFYAIYTLNWVLITIIIFFMSVQHFAHKSDIFVRLVKKHCPPTKYFRRFLRIYDEEIDDEENTMFCIHPHSEFSYGVLVNMNADDTKMSRMIGLASRFILFTPYTGLQVKLWGVQSVDKQNLKRLMSEKKTIGIVPGGYEQATLTTPNQIRVYIKNRYGFLKYALRYGYTVRPTLIYNEHKAFKTFDHLRKFRLMLNKIKIPAVWYFGGFLQIFYPIGLEMITIVGRGIKRDPQNQGKVVTHEEVEDAHQRYIAELKRLHNAYKDEFHESPLVLY